jgi:hypothetical protein
MTYYGIPYEMSRVFQRFFSTRSSKLAVVQFVVKQAGLQQFGMRAGGQDTPLFKNHNIGEFAGRFEDIVDTLIGGEHAVDKKSMTSCSTTRDNRRWFIWNSAL